MAKVLLRCVLLCAVVLLAASSGRGDEDAGPLWQRIDAVIDAARVGPASPLASDEEFLRRIYLDLAGVIPTVAEARAFLDDNSADQRQRLVDRLLADPRFNRNMQIVFDVMLMERRPKKHIAEADWREYLHASIEQHKPLDRLASEILQADGTEGRIRPAARFYLDREGQTHLLTRDIGRLFLGMDLQCAQCHDHPLIDGYAQADYFGIYAFLNRSFLFTEKKSKKTFFAEKAEGEVTFISVFDKDTKQQTGPRMPGGVKLAEPKQEKGQEYHVKPAKGVRPVPKYSRRQLLAREMTNGNCQAFNSNMANRLWAHMLGRGLVHPLDLHHADNPPAHPRLLALLADELVKMKFDVRRILRQIALSQTYQRGSRMLEGLADSTAEAQMRLAEAEAKHNSLAEAVNAAEKEKNDLTGKIAAAGKAVQAAAGQLNMAKTASATAAKQAATALAAMQVANQQAAAKAEIAKSVTNLAQLAQQVSGKIPEDKELAEAAAKIQTRAVKLVEQRDQMKKLAREQVAASQAAAKAGAAAKNSLDKAATVHAEEEKSLAALVHLKDHAIENATAARIGIITTTGVVQDARMLLEYSRAADSEAKAEAVAARDKLAARWSDRFFLYDLKPLAPEPLAMSVMQSLGVLDQRLAAAEKAEREKAKKENKPVDEKELPRRVELAVYKQCQSEITKFISIYRQARGQPTRDYLGTVEEALYLANSDLFKTWLQPKGGNLSDRLIHMEDPSALAEELYLAVLTRRPEPEETATLAGYLAGRTGDRPAAVQEMLWGLLSSVEFRFSH